MEGHHLIGKLSLAVGEVGGGGEQTEEQESDLTSGRPSFNWEVISRSGGGWGGGEQTEEQESDLTNGRPSFNWEVISHSGGGWGGGGGANGRARA